PKRMEEPEFTDDALSKMWIFVRSSIVRDDKTYRVKSAKKRYAAFCRYSKERGYDPPISMETWKSLGEPNYSEFAKANEERLHTLAMQSNATQSNALQCMPTAYSPPTSTSLSTTTAIPASSSESGRAQAGGAAARPAAAFDPLPPSLDGALTKWVMHWEQTKRQTFPQSSRNVLRAEFRTYAEEYGAEAVVKLIDTAVSNAWKTVPWDRLERWRQEAPPAKKGAGRPSEAGKYAQELAERRRKKQ
ncbi:MAG: hypothetical protein IKN96_07180, partial [Oscillibacter sp.]|nr:hypothetical protein [Oscillibacter sp.]